MNQKLSTNKKCNIWLWVAIIAVILFVIIVRVRLLEVPLERDEGGYAYNGQLVLQGIPPYKEIYNLKMPGLYCTYALIMAVFGQTIKGIHLGLMIINVVTIILMFFLGKRLFNVHVGVVSAISFAIMSLSASVQGIFANAEHFILPFVIGGLLLLLKAIDNHKLKWFFFSGLLFGISFIIKQVSLFFVIFAIIYLIIIELNKKPFKLSDFTSRFILFSLGIVTPLMLTCLVFASLRVFGKFWLWSFIYAHKYVSLLPFSTGFKLFLKYVTQVIKSSFLFWIFACFSISALLCEEKIQKQGLFIGLFLVFSFLSICVGLYFRPHYFILLLPPIALLSAVGISFIGRNKISIVILLSVIALSYSTYIQRKMLFQLDHQGVCRNVYTYQPFIESLKISDYIKTRTSKNDKIAVIGSEPQIYFYSKRRSATGHIYMYQLMESKGYALKMRKEMIKEIEISQPKFIVFVNNILSWRSEAIHNLDLSIFKWFEDYSKKYYKRVGVVDMVSSVSSEYYWDNKSVGYIPRSKFWISIFKRKI